MNTAANIIAFLSNATLFVCVVRTWDQPKLVAITVALAATSVTTDAHASLWSLPPLAFIHSACDRMLNANNHRRGVMAQIEIS
jgi:hypothetical protein